MLALSAGGLTGQIAGGDAEQLRQLRADMERLLELPAQRRATSKLWRGVAARAPEFGGVEHDRLRHQLLAGIADRLAASAGSDLDAMCAVFDLAALFHAREHPGRAQLDAVTEDLALVLADRKPNGLAAAGSRFYRGGRFGDRGFHASFRDQSDQVRHSVWALRVFANANDLSSGLRILRLKEERDSRSRKLPVNETDLALNAAVQGVAAAALFSVPPISAARFGTLLRFALGQRRKDGRADHSLVPGVVIDHSPASSRRYIGSPSLARLPDGTYVASHDFFGPGSGENLTRLFASRDRGQTWRRLCELRGQFWSNLFVHRRALYLMGTSKAYGSVVIRRSTDGGRTWTIPKDRETGVLLGDGRYHCAPVPVVTHAGRLWRAMEDADGPGGWGSHFRSFMMSARVEADLLRASSWTCSDRLGRDPMWLGGNFGGWLEGNAVVRRDGGLVNILRVDHRPHGGKAAIVSISEDGTRASFSPKTGFIAFPGGCKKFTIRFDPVSKSYWSLTNQVAEKQRGGNAERIRNTLTLISSRDLRSWQVNKVVLHHPDAKRCGFQYADWQFDGADLIVVSRTAFPDGLGGAGEQHDANYLTFHRIEGFRRFAGELSEKR